MIISSFNIYDSYLEDFKEYLRGEESIEKLKTIAKLTKEHDDEKYKHVLNLLHKLEKNDKICKKK